MTTPQDKFTGAALSIAEIAGRDVAILEQLEGKLLIAGGAGHEISPAEVANSTGMDRSKAVDIFRQLRQSEAVERVEVGATINQSTYKVLTDRVRKVFHTSRESVSIIQTHEERSQPTSQVQPLVTFPEDPSFEGASPYDYGMKWLMPSLISSIKNSTDSITIMTPFFDQDGFETLEGVLIDSLDRGVSLDVITRYLTDSGSYNRHVLSNFVASVQENGAPTSNLSFIDYTVWDDSVPVDERTQEGENPAFTLHAKLMLFDDREAYVGSANVTDYGFDRYLEIGALFTGPPVTNLGNLVEFLIESRAASEVEVFTRSS